MSLASKLDTTKIAVRAALPGPTFAAIEQSIVDLRDSGLAERAVGVGDLIALPILRTIDDLPVDLMETAAGRLVVLVFTRGGWCPYCNTTLRAYAEALPRIEAAGGTLIAVTPESPGRAFEAARSSDLRFTIAVDGGNRFAESLGLVSRCRVTCARCTGRSASICRTGTATRAIPCPFPPPTSWRPAAA